MYELIQVGPRSYYINAPVKIGLSLLQDNQVCLIDSGNDKDAGRKIRQLLEQHGWQLQMILNTHSNADHIGEINTCKTDRMPYLRPWHRVCPDPTSTAGALLPVRRVPSQRPAPQIPPGTAKPSRVPHR